MNHPTFPNFTQWQPGSYQLLPETMTLAQTQHAGIPMAPQYSPFQGSLMTSNIPTQHGRRPPVAMRPSKPKDTLVARILVSSDELEGKDLEPDIALQSLHGVHNSRE